MHSTATQERAPDPEPAVATATVLARSPATAMRALQRRVGNRAVARLLGPALREARFRSLIGSEAANRGQMLFHGVFVEILRFALNNAQSTGGTFAKAGSQTITINFADQLSFAVNYLYSTFSTGIHTLAASIAFFFIYFYNVSQGHSKTPSNSAFRPNLHRDCQSALY